MRTLIILMILVFITSCRQEAKILIKNETSSVIEKIKLGYKNYSWNYNHRRLGLEQQVFTSHKRSYGEKPMGPEIYVSYKVENVDYKATFNLSSEQVYRGFRLVFYEQETKDGFDVDVSISENF